MFSPGQIVTILDCRNGDEHGPYERGSSNPSYVPLLNKQVRIVAKGRFHAYDIEPVEKIKRFHPKSAYPWRFRSTPEDQDAETDF